MLMELVQMALAIGLFTVGLILLAMIHLAQSGKTLRLAPPVWARWPLGLLAVAVVVAACQPVMPAAAPTTTAAEEDVANADTARLIIYSGRNENLVGPLIEQFKEQSGIDVQVRYGDTAEMAATILEEGDNSPADLFFAQDAGALGALAQEGRFVELPTALTEPVEARFRSPENLWVGISGRARVLVYNTDLVSEADLPASVFDLTREEWRGQVGWAPSNGSFQSFVTALRKVAGEEATQTWLEGMIANEVQVYPNNNAIVTAVGAGEIAIGLVNHYYLYQFIKEQGEGFPARNHYFPAGDVGAMVNVAGVGILASGTNQEAAQQFVEFLLATEAQQYFATQTNEYPLTSAEIEINPMLKPLSEIVTPEIELSNLSDLQGTLTMLQDVGALE
jgi:iron(III) transport system substrate-binding protein